MRVEGEWDVEWDEIRAEKSVYMEELMEAVKRQTELMVVVGVGSDGVEVTVWCRVLRHWVFMFVVVILHVVFI